MGRAMIHLRRRTAIGPFGEGRGSLRIGVLPPSSLGALCEIPGDGGRILLLVPFRPIYRSKSETSPTEPPAAEPTLRSMKMRTRTIVLYTTLSVAVVGAGGLAYGAIDSSGTSSAKTATRLVSATVGTVSQTVTATGTVQPATTLDLNFATGGVLTAVKVKAGAKVGIGQVLATIDPAKATVGLESAQAAQAAAQQKLDRARNPPADAGGAVPAVDAVAVAQAKAALNQAILDTSNAKQALDA